MTAAPKIRGCVAPECLPPPFIFVDCNDGQKHVGIWIPTMTAVAPATKTDTALRCGSARTTSLMRVAGSAQHPARPAKPGAAGVADHR